MTNKKIPRILITGATGQVGGKTLQILLKNNEVTVVAAVRTAEKAKIFEEQGIETAILDFDNAHTHLPAFEGIDAMFMVTGYTVDMLAQSKVMADNAKKADIKHMVHLGACGPDDATVGHWVWHQLVERYIEWLGFSFTHLRPQDFMQNLLSYGSDKATKGGIINGYIGDASLSWVDADDVAKVAAVTLSQPELHNGKTYRLSADAKTFYEIADLMNSIVGKPFKYEPLSPQTFIQKMRENGAEMAYMNCVGEHWKMHANGEIPGASDTFENILKVTGEESMKWVDFIKKHKADLNY